MAWQGEFAFGDFWMGFRGASDDNREHAHAALQLVVGEALVLHDDHGARLHGRAWLIASQVRHRLEPGASLTLLLLDPDAPLARALRRALRCERITALPDAMRDRLLKPQPLPATIAALTSELALVPPPLDARISLALEAIACGETMSRAATAAGLSVSRLRALAQQTFGLPLSKLATWRRIRTACAAMQRGCTLAAAAAEAGFADQAHLTRTMADVIGLTPGEASRIAG